MMSIEVDEVICQPIPSHSVSPAIPWSIDPYIFIRTKSFKFEIIVLEHFIHIDIGR